MQKSLTKNAIYNIIYTVINIGFPFITSVYISRILLPDGVGKVASAQNVVSYFVTAAALGLPSYGVREFSKIRENKSEKNKLFTELLLLNTISTTLILAIFLLFIFVNKGFDDNEWKLYVACGFSIFFNYLNIDWMYQGLEEYGYITGRSLCIKLLSLISLFLFVNTQQDYVIYALISSFATGGNYIFNVIHARKYIKVEFSEIELKKHLKPLFLIAVIIFLSSIYNKIDITMLNIMATDKSVGYYVYAQKMVVMVLTLTNAVTGALLPRLSYYYENDIDEFYRLLNRGFQILCFFTFPLAAGMILVSPQIVRMFYGRAFEPTALTIQLMSPLILIKGFGDLFCYQLAYSTKNEKIILPAAIVASISNIIVNVVLIPLLLQNGAVIASVISELSTNMIQFVYMKKKVRFNINWKVVVMGLLSTVLMSVCVWGVMLLNLPDLIGLIVEVSYGVAVYTGINLVLKNTLVMEILKKIKSNMI